MSQNGKGDKRRPMAIDFETYAKNWNCIFETKTCPGYECTYQHKPVEEDNPCVNCGRPWAICVGLAPPKEAK